VSKYLGPTTIRLTRSLAAGVRRTAKAKGISKSEALRRLLAAALAEPVEPPHLLSFGTGGQHRIAIELDAMDDDASEATKNATARRNTSLVSLKCASCDAELELVDVPPTRCTESRHPAVAVSHSPAPSRRVRFDARLAHRPDCRISRPSEVTT